MSEFKRLLLVLEKELSHHETLLDLLNRERAAIVTLNPEQLEKLNIEKEKVLDAAKECESRRRELIDSIIAANETLAVGTSANVPLSTGSSSAAPFSGSAYSNSVSTGPSTDPNKKNAPAAPVFSEIIGVCQQSDVRNELSKIGSELKATAEVVRDMNTHNALLIKQSLGLISSTLSIIRSTPGSDLPTYGQGGVLRDQADDPAFAGRSRGVTRQA